MTIPSVMPIVATTSAMGINLVDNGCMLRLIQWIDDNADIANDATLVMAINGQTLTAKLQFTSDVAMSPITIWQIGPFNPGIRVDNINITALATGAVHIWFD